MPRIPYYRRNLFVLWLAVFLAANSWTQVVPFLPLFLLEIGAGARVSEWSGVVFSIQFVSAIFMMPFWGKLADRVGRKPMMLRAGFCLSMIYIGMSFAAAPWQLAALRFLNGALTGFIPMGTTIVATNTPKQLSARYVTAIQTAGAAGTILGPAIGGLLAGAFGYRTAMRVSAALVGLSTLLVAWLVQERRRAAPTTRTSMLEDVRTGLAHPVMRIVLVASALATLGSVGIQPILTLYLEQLGAHQEWISGVVFSIPGIAFVLFAARWTRLGEVRGFDRTLIYGFAGSAFGGVLLALVPGLYAFSGAYLWFGLFSAAVGPSCAALISQHVDSGFAGRAFSLQQSANMAGGLLGPMTAGFIAGRFGPSATFWLTAAVFAGGIIWVLRLAARWRTSTRTGAAA